MSTASLNEVRLIGNLGADPEVRHTASGIQVATITIATTYYRAEEEFTEWHRVVLWKHLAERAQKYLRKGASVFIAGRLQTRRWTDDQNVERWATEVVADSMQMLGSKKAADGGEAGEGAAPSSAKPRKDGRADRPSANPAPEPQEDDVPF